jgi:hypothetical protein
MRRSKSGSIRTWRSSARERTERLEQLIGDRGVRVFFPHSLRAICDGAGRIRGLSTRIRRLEARVAGQQHSYAQTKDRRCKDRRKDGRRAIEGEESDQGSDHGTSDRPKESTEEQPAAEPPVHPSLGRALSSNPMLAPRFGCTFLHERCDTRDSRLQPFDTSDSLLDFSTQPSGHPA